MNIYGQLQEFISNNIIIPSDIQKVSNRNIELCTVDSLSKWIILIDSLQCSSCRIYHLYDFLPGYEMLDSIPDCELMAIFSPRQEEYDEVVKQLMILNFPYPVYVDYSCSFRKLNSFIPDDTRFHSFVIDKNRKPVFVGNPMSGQKMMDLFIQVVSNLEANGGVYVEPEER